MVRKKYNSTVISQIIDLYQSGSTSSQIAHQFNCSATFVLNSLRRNNIPIRSTTQYTTKYLADENFFQVIDSQEKAYILGFLYADGNNYIKPPHHYEISCKLQALDKSHLETIRDIISPTSIIKEIDNPPYPACLLKINNKTISQQLTNLGCTPNKSLTLTFPSWLTSVEMQQHFIRGYFDGDGCLYQKQPTPTGYINWGWQITSTHDFCQDVKNIIQQHLNITPSLHLSGKNTITTTLSVGGNLQVKKLLSWMYQEATIYLPRKYSKYLELIS
jgi:hypothetical protein